MTLSASDRYRYAVRLLEVARSPARCGEARIGLDGGGSIGCEGGRIRTVLRRLPARCPA
ncbi:hypothetical protein [Streptomyces sp. YKOK-I1]